MAFSTSRIHLREYREVCEKREFLLDVREIRLNCVIRVRAAPRPRGLVKRL